VSSTETAGRGACRAPSAVEIGTTYTVGDGIRFQSRVKDPSGKLDHILSTGADAISLEDLREIEKRVEDSGAPSRPERPERPVSPARRSA